jgi:putative transposase
MPTQLCAVHMQHNAKTHLSKTDRTEFPQRWRAIKSSWDVEVSHRQFEELCDRFAKAYPTWIGELRKKREHYLAFLKYPESMRRSFSTTNVVEAINVQLEMMRRNSGGYFHSEETLQFKLGLAISSLEDSRWRTVARSFASAIPQLNALFQPRFEETR